MFYKQLIGIRRWREKKRYLPVLIVADIEVHADVRKNLDHILADPISIRQVIMNLCTNAAMP